MSSQYDTNDNTNFIDDDDDDDDDFNFENAEEAERDDSDDLDFEFNSINPKLNDEDENENDLKTYFSFVLLGVGVLTPYNTFISAVDYFIDKFDDSFEFYVSFCFTYSTLFAVAMNTILVGKFHPYKRILI
eukprot:Pgem_evm1s13463